MGLWISGFKSVTGFRLNSLACKCLGLLVIVLVARAIFLANHSAYDVVHHVGGLGLVGIHSLALQSSNNGFQGNKFLEVPQIVWGLNNQKIALARACLTAKILNRTLLMPSLSASLFYKEIDQLVPISFDKVFQFERFNSLCNGFVRLGRHSDISNQTNVFVLQKGSGRKWTVERDLVQLKQLSEHPYHEYEVIKIEGKNPFMWHDHWPVRDYARVFECLVLVDEYAKEADKVVSMIRRAGEVATSGKKLVASQNVAITEKGYILQPTPYVAVHMRIEIDWMIHCKKTEERLKINQICSSKEEIVKRVGQIVNSTEPIVVYLAVADSLLKEKTIHDGWKKGLIPLDKKKLGVEGIYAKYPYLIKSAIDYEVCSRADIFVGNSFSTFSSLIALERTQRLLRSGVKSLCSTDVRWPSYAYNILGENDGPQKWFTNMSDPNLQSISYGTSHVSC